MYKDYSSIKGDGKNIMTFYLLAFTVAWIVWMPILLSVHNIIPVKFPLWLSYLGGIAPIGAGLLMTYREQGSQGMIDIFRRWIMIKFPIKYYFIALLLPALNIVIPLLILGIKEIPTLSRWLPLYLIQLPLITAIAIFEEAGWRGYASPRLQEKFGKYPASILMGMLWAVWHWPYWLTPGLGFITGLSFNKTIIALFLTLVGTAAFETQLSWLFNKVKGSIFFACFFHAAYNSLWLALINGTENKQLNTTYIGPLVSLLLALCLYLYDRRELSRN
jgi:membrane protease YdiL (CAAX protease family)